jgi:hypothetical protein
MKTFFKKMKGVVVTSEGKCASYNVALSTVSPPKFSTPFLRILERLHAAVKSGLSSFINPLVKTLLSEFGTHFPVEAEMGATYRRVRHFATNDKSKVSADALLECSKRETQNALFPDVTLDGGLTSEAGTLNVDGNEVIESLYKLNYALTARGM